MKICIFFLQFWMFVYTIVDARGSCRRANLCCDGRDSNCAVYDTLNGVEKACYCDHACLRVGDCCEDFQQVCGVVDCEISPWGLWSACSSDCGTGVMTRERNVLQSPRNGGRACPELLQKRSCYGNQCHEKTASREMAMILPATYSSIRHLNATQDIRNNLRLRYQKEPGEENRKEYCIVFEITKVRKTCENFGNEKLTVGSKVCTACETAAMRKHLGYRCQGHGTELKSTRFTVLAFPQCYGRWQRLEITDKCTCSSDAKPDFIFV